MGKAKKEKSLLSTISPTESPSHASAWTKDEDSKLQKMRKEGLGWEVIGRHLGRTSASCRFHFARLQAKTGTQEWVEEDEKRFKVAYQKKKSAMWSMVASEMWFEGSWRALETKAFEMGMKGLR